MKNIIASILLCTMVVSATFVITAPVKAASSTITVPDDYPTIQQAVNAAAPSDTVFVRSGTYYEHVTIGKSLTLQGEDRDTTIIDGSGSGSVVYITANYVTISGLTVTNGEYGIHFIANWRIHHVTIRDAIITSNDKRGIYAAHSYYPGAYHVIEDCIISNNGTFGLYAHQFSKSIVRNCEVFGNLAGLAVGWGFDTLITNNKVHHHVVGIDLDAMRDTIVEKNSVYANSRAGIQVRYVYGYNIIRDNIVRNNTIGIDTDTWTSGNRIYHNDLIENTRQANDPYSRNMWDNGYPSGGNYWSDYIGLDLYSGMNQDEPGSDGIGDTPYVFDYGQDSYPLMSPWVIEPPVASTGPDQTVILGETVTLDGSGSSDSDGTIMSYEWDFGDSSTGSGETTTHVYTSAGIYTVALTVTDDDGATDTDILIITVQIPAEATQDLISDVEDINLPGGIENSLVSVLEVAIISLDNGQENAAVNQFNALINLVEAQRGKKITEEQADELIAKAQRIIDNI